MAPAPQESAGAAPVEPDTTSDRIGSKDSTVRAIGFTGGGFDTAMQLGVIHALMVSRAKAPDVVVGVSAGAFNAVALAETLQAGSTDGTDSPGDTDEKARRRQTEERLGHRVAAFRRLFGRYRDAPGELASALLPDSYQIDSRKPLKVLRLSTHFTEERRARSLGSRSRRGLVNLYNQLLTVPLSVGTITRAVRRFLGLKAARYIAAWRSPSSLHATLKKGAAQFPQVILLWKLLGWNLHKLAPIAVLLRGGFRSGTGLHDLQVGEESRPPGASPGGSAEATRDEGLTAGELLFASRFWPWVGRVMLHGFLFLTWTVFWAGLTGLALGAVALLGMGAVWSVGSLLALAVDGIGVPRFPPESWQNGVLLATGYLALGSLLGAAVYAAVLRSWQRFRAALKTLVELSGLTLAWGMVALALAYSVAWLVAWILPGPVGDAVRAGGLFSPPPGLGPLAAAAGIGLFVIGAIQAVLIAIRRRDLVREVLRRHSLGRSLLDPHPLRELLVSIFDPAYYGPHGDGAAVRLEEVVASALNEDQPVDLGHERRTLAHYHTATDPPIRVAVVAADVERGRPEVLAPDWSVVDALMAATASVPFFPAVGRTDNDGNLHWYVDASGVANEPTRMSLAYMRTRLRDDVSAVKLYSVSPFPLSARTDSTPDRDRNAFKTLVEVVTRAKELERYRDARLEHRLTRLYSKVMGRRNTLQVIRQRPEPDGTDRKAEKKAINASVHAIEPDAPLRLSRRLLGENDDRKRRQIVAEGVAAGCRAMLEVIALEPGDDNALPVIECWTAMKERLEANPEVPGADDRYGPGVPEVCSACRASFVRTRRREPPDEKRRDAGTKENADNASEGLLVRRGEDVVSIWPFEWEKEAVPGPTDEPREGAVPDAEAGPGEPDAGKPNASDECGPRNRQAEENDDGGALLLSQWPRGSDGSADCKRPTVSFVFSGGVFRGVFQVGVIAAVNELGIRPDIVAGASVGSITAAMAATAYTVGKSTDRPADMDARRRAIARMAATYLAVDRLVLTDRFADFVREFTVRAAAARFSLKDVDRVVRKYDEALPGIYGREGRRLAAGIERLTYISPLELARLVRDLRTRDTAKVAAQLRDYFQELLDRSGVGREILGAEPLAFLIREHVLRPLADAMPGFDRSALDRIPIGTFLDQAQIYFVATATNLHAARLELLGDVTQNEHGPHGETHAGAPHDRLSDSLLESLLASSAFPGVFRPRWSWEVRPDSGREELLIDGGVMDNLPLDAVAEFLCTAADEGVITARPGRHPGEKRESATGTGTGTPHLILCTSLRPSPVELADDAAGRAGSAASVPPADVVLDMVNDWYRLRTRVREMKYNDKIDMYANTQAMLRAIVESSEEPDEHFPLDLEVVAITPRWVCGTFAFHPMLGFQRTDQARSIAHGCASTRVQMETIRRWRPAWVERWVAPDRQGQPCADRAAIPEWWKLERTAKARKTGLEKGHCWFRPADPCPFSMVQLKKSFAEELDGQRKESVSKLIEEVAEIHSLCGKSTTHNPG